MGRVEDSHVSLPARRESQDALKAGMGHWDQLGHPVGLVLPVDHCREQRGPVLTALCKVKTVALSLSCRLPTLWPTSPLQVRS